MNAPAPQIKCFQCHKMVPVLGQVGRREECPFCRADLHVCLNCQHYDPASYNECHEPQAERVLEKDRANFCDFFTPGGGSAKAGTSKDELLSAAEALLRKISKVLVFVVLRGAYSKPPTSGLINLNHQQGCGRMASAETTDLFSCSVEQFYKIVTDYEKYPEFLSEVKKCKVLKSEGQKKLIEYTVSMMKDFKYTLWMTEQPEYITWEFASGEIFKTMKGFWKLQNEGGKCRATYSLEATFGLLVPSPIAKALVSVNLPNMISSYHKRVAELYGR